MDGAGSEFEVQPDTFVYAIGLPNPFIANNSQIVGDFERNRDRTLLGPEKSMKIWTIIHLLSMA
jgi:hypothetical protein